MVLLISISVFFAITVIGVLIGLLVRTDAKQDVIRRRMDAVRKAERRGSASLELKLVRDEMLSSVPLIHQLMMRWSWSTHLRDFLVQAGVKTKPGKLLLQCCVCSVATYVAGSFLFPRFRLLVLLAGIAIGAIPFVFIAWKRSRRLRKFEENFPAALDLLGRAVRAGHAFTTGLEMIATEAAEPVAGEFRTTFEEQNFGLPLRDALLNLTERVPILDVRFFVTALMIQRETGGNLAEILDGLARVIRDRFRIYREVRVKTAQGRLTAGILIALPIFMAFMLSILNPHYMRVLFDDPKGPPILALAATLQLIGSLIIWKIIHIEV